MEQVRCLLVIYGLELALLQLQQRVYRRPASRPPHQLFASAGQGVVVVYLEAVFDHRLGGLLSGSLAGSAGTS
jgi:hypothetical protein